MFWGFLSIARMAPQGLENWICGGGEERDKSFHPEKLTADRCCQLPAPLQTAQDELSPGLGEHFHKLLRPGCVWREHLPHLRHNRRLVLR